MKQTMKGNRVQAAAQRGESVDQELPDAAEDAAAVGGLDSFRTQAHLDSNLAALLAQVADPTILLQPHEHLSSAARATAQVCSLLSQEEGHQGCFPCCEVNASLHGLWLHGLPSRPSPQTCALNPGAVQVLGRTATLGLL